MFKEFVPIFNNNFAVNMNDIEFPLTSYVEQTLLEIKSANVPTIIVYPDGNELNTMLLPYIALYSRYKNFFGDITDLAKALEIDEFIYYDSRLGKFKGKKIYKEWGACADSLPEDLRNSQAIKIEFAHGDTGYITEKDFYKITRYKGGATRLNNIEKCNNDKKNTVLIEQFGLSTTAVSTLINSTVLYIKNKIEADNIVNSTTTNFGPIKKEKLSNVAPLAYWTNNGKKINYSGNRQGLTPVVNITSNLENAINLLYNKNEINLVIVDLADLRGIDFNLLEQIVDLTEKIGLIILLPFKKYKDFTEYFEKSKFDQIVVTKSKAARYLKNSPKESIQVNQQIIFNNYVDRNIQFDDIKENEKICFLKVYKELNFLLSGPSVDEKIRDLISKSFGLLSSLKSYMAFDTPNSNENSIYVKKQLKDIETDILEILQNDSFYSAEKLQLILEMQKDLLKIVFSENKMASKAKEILKYSTSKRILFIVQNNRVKSIFDSYVKERFRDKIVHCKTISKVQRDVFYDITYILGVVPNPKLSSTLFSLMSSKRMVFVYYESYLNYIKFLYKNNVLNLLEEELISEIMYEELLTDSEQKKADYNLISELTQVVNGYNYKDAFRIYFGNNEDEDSSKCDYLVNFNEYIGVFKKDYKVYRVNLEEQNLEDAKVSTLSIGDEILILNEKFKSGSFLEEIIEALLQDFDFQNKYSKKIKLSKMWKKILSDYLENHNLRPSQLYQLLKAKGLKKTYTTFRNWIFNDYIVGPDQESDYKLIFSLNPELYSSWKTVFDACNMVRSLHIKLRHDIGKMIVESYFNDKVISKNLSYLDIDFMSKVTICEVAKIDKGEFRVANYMVNAVKRKEA
ncbi:DrmE family protein [Fusibacter ferrireducens]|uniref:DISARM protein DrmE C-terminal domain-containing protein n=1 Tax=Fusibacter ferrireducens TaxID=2785058 RepID=A0ABR9ZZW7_9FIRM|nr:DrmE family protein [Fusibacter ferrireducens]MBF4695992.1 hypothetical protein [Fusibacter ferrireducens]